MLNFQSFITESNSKTEKFKIHNDLAETHPEFSQEHNVQNSLFGSNDYLPFHEKVMKESIEDVADNDKRIVVKADGGKSAAAGAVVPKHMWEGGKAKGGGHYKGMNERNEMRAKVYGPEHRAPLGLGQIADIHKKTLADHFAKPKSEQIAAEKGAIERLHAAGHLDSRDTTDEGEKTDTVHHEYDEKGRSFVARSSKGVAGHAVYTSGSGANQKHHILNTCPAQTTGCGGGVDAKGIADTSKGTCFAPKAESQYSGAAVRRSCHEQAKHDPAMTNDWALAHTHSLRNASNAADKQGKRFLFRPNVVDETDRSSRHVIKHLNTQRKAEGKPPIVANSYGKTNELHDPVNDYHVTSSNIGPKVKHGKEITQNKQRDNMRVRQTVSATEASGKDIKNDEGKSTPPKNSYLVTNMKRGGDMDKAFQKNVTHAKYWSEGKEEHQLSPAERAEGSEGHFDGKGKPTTPDKAHYGHKTITGADGKSRRYDYQNQHILHPRLVSVGTNKDGTDHKIPTDSRFKDNDFLPKERFKTKNGKDAGAIVATTPTTSTSDVQHHSNFTHDVNAEHIKHAAANNGEYEIDKPEHQEAARGKEYSAPSAPAKKVKGTEMAPPTQPSMADMQSKMAAASAKIKSSPEYKARVAALNPAK